MHTYHASVFPRPRTCLANSDSGQEFCGALIRVHLLMNSLKMNSLKAATPINCLCVIRASATPLPSTPSAPGAQQGSNQGHMKKPVKQQPSS